MRALLDTHALLWWLLDSESLTKPARKIMAERRNAVLVSAASAWEIATKVRLGKLPGVEDVAADFSGIMAQEGFELLSISADHAIRAGGLPGFHRDPFDRMLIAQAQSENLPLISKEAAFDHYGVGRIW
jgi:PIN domain nuclease of toxin-antitoxin system